MRYLLNMQVELVSRQSDKGMWDSGNGPGYMCEYQSAPANRLADSLRRGSSDREEAQGLSLGCSSAALPNRIFCDDETFSVCSIQYTSH